MKDHSSLPVLEQWIVSLRFKDDKERREFHNIIKNSKSILKDYIIEFGGTSPDWLSLPIIKISKRLKE